MKCGHCAPILCLPLNDNPNTHQALGHARLWLCLFWSKVLRLCSYIWANGYEQNRCVCYLQGVSQMQGLILATTSLFLVDWKIDMVGKSQLGWKSDKWESCLSNSQLKQYIAHSSGSQCFSNEWKMECSVRQLMPPLGTESSRMSVWWEAILHFYWEGICKNNE